MRKEDRRWEEKEGEKLEPAAASVSTRSLPPLSAKTGSPFLDALAAGGSADTIAETKDTPAISTLFLASQLSFRRAIRPKEFLDRNLRI